MQAGSNSSSGNATNSTYTFWEGAPEWNTLTFACEGGTGASGSFLIQGLCDGGLSGGQPGLWPNLLVYRTNSNGSAFVGQVGGGASAVSINTGAVQPQLMQANITGLTALRIQVQSAITGPVKFTWVLTAGATSLYNFNPSILNSGGAQATDTVTPMGAINNLNTTAAISVAMYGGAGASSGNNSFQAYRIPQIFKTASVSAGTSGNSTVWTPTSGKKFRLMRFDLSGSNLSAAAATVVTLSFQDNTTGLAPTYDVLLPATVNTVSGTTAITNWIDLGNGILSAAANNVLNLNVSSAPAGAAGTYRVNVCGTEE